MPSSLSPSASTAPSLVLPWTLLSSFSTLRSCLEVGEGRTGGLTSLFHTVDLDKTSQKGAKSFIAQLPLGQSSSQPKPGHDDAAEGLCLECDSSTPLPARHRLQDGRGSHDPAPSAATEKSRLPTGARVQGGGGAGDCPAHLASVAVSRVDPVPPPDGGCCRAYQRPPVRHVLRALRSWLFHTSVFLQHP